jgi:hypothetical protein
MTIIRDQVIIEPFPEFFELVHQGLSSFSPLVGPDDILLSFGSFQLKFGFFDEFYFLALDQMDYIVGETSSEGSDCLFDVSGGDHLAYVFRDQVFDDFVDGLITFMVEMVDGWQRETFFDKIIVVFDDEMFEQIIVHAIRKEAREEILAAAVLIEQLVRGRRDEP